MATLTCYCSYSSTPVPKSLSFPKIPNPQLFTKYSSSFLSISSNQKWNPRASIALQCSNFNTSSSFTLSESELETETETETEEEEEEEGDDGVTSLAKKPPVKRKRRRYRKQYPGEKKGITEEMRFVAMKLRNSKAKDSSSESENGYESASSEEDNNNNNNNNNNIGGDGGTEETWQPSVEGFLKYLVDSKLVFTTIERVVDDSSDVSYAYFRRTGLERADCISKDLDWFSQQGYEIPEPSNPGVSYASYLEELAEKTPPLFLSHFYNIYFSHIAGGQVIGKKAFEKLLEEKELEFHKWEGDAEELLRGVREKFNMLAKHWSRDDKNKCLREVTKAFRFMGQIVRLIIL